MLDHQATCPTFRLSPRGIRALVVALTAAGVVCVAGVGLRAAGVKHRQVRPANDPDLGMKSEALWKEFEGGRAPAEQRYGGQTLRITGRVTWVLPRNRVVTLWGGTPSRLLGVDCLFPEAGAFPGLWVGQLVTVEGRCQGGTPNLQLAACRVVAVREADAKGHSRGGSGRQKDAPWASGWGDGLRR